MREKPPSLTGSEVGPKQEIRDKEGRLVRTSLMSNIDGQADGFLCGVSMIDYEITCLSSPRFVFHDSRGIEAAGAESDCHGMEAGA